MQDVSFNDLQLPEWLTARLAEVGYDAPTPVQAAAIPKVREGLDVVAQAQTGTGKTAAFAIPILSMTKAEDGPIQVVVLAPTRELARQVSDEFSTLGEGSGLETFAIYGGVSMEPQIEAFGRAHILVATPGRLLDHLRRGTLKFDNLRIFGLDEADEMLSMGFEREITEVLSLLPEKRQNLLFSATMPAEVMRFADNFLVDAEKLNLSSDSVGAASVHHLAYQLKGTERVAALRTLLRSHMVRGAIIFANTKSETFRVHDLLEAEGYSVGVLNGDLPQRDREKILVRLKEETLDFLVATDIAARGIDISWLRAVINYEMPETAETYIHRTGRTGRAGTVGTAYSFVTPGDVSVFHQLQKLYDIRFEIAKVPDRHAVRALRADEEIQRLLEKLDEDQRLVYGQYLAVARRLAERDGGDREIAKLLAFFEGAQSFAGASMTAPAERSAKASAPAAEPMAARPAAEPERPQERPAREERSERAPREQRVETTPPASQPAAAVGGDDEIYQWILENSRSTNPTRSTHAIAKALGVSEDEVNERAATDARLERLTGRNTRWRIIREEDAAAAAEAPRSNADADRAPEARVRVQQDDTPAPRARMETTSEAPARRSQPSRPATPMVRSQPQSWVSLRVNVGNDKFGNDRDLARWFAEYAGFEDSDIRAVDLREKSAVVEVDESYWRDFIEALHNQPWDGHQLNVHRAR